MLIVMMTGVGSRLIGLGGKLKECLFKPKVCGIFKTRSACRVTRKLQLAVQRQLYFRHVDILFFIKHMTLQNQTSPYAFITGDAISVFYVAILTSRNYQTNKIFQQTAISRVYLPKLSRRSLNFSFFFFLLSFRSSFSSKRKSFAFVRSVVAVHNNNGGKVALLSFYQ